MSLFRLLYNLTFLRACWTNKKHRADKTKSRTLPVHMGRKTILFLLIIAKNTAVRCEGGGGQTEGTVIGVDSL